MVHDAEAEAKSEKAKGSISALLLLLEEGRASEALEEAWGILHGRIIPFEEKEILSTLSQYILILRHMLQIKEVRADVLRIHGILDLIIHPRKSFVTCEREVPRDEAPAAADASAPSRTAERETGSDIEIME